MGLWNWGKGKKAPQIRTLVEVDSDRVSCTGEVNIQRYGIQYQTMDMCNVGIVILCS